MYTRTSTEQDLWDRLLDVQHTRLLRLDFPRGDAPKRGRLVPNRLHAQEHLSRDFRFELELLSDSPHIPLKEMMGKMLTVSVVREDGSLRHFNGHVFEFRFVRNDGGYAYYQAVLGPWLAFLHHRVDNRVFHGKTIEQQTALIFAQYDVADWRRLWWVTDEPMTTATQFAESDHNYLHRRWESLGLYYWYEHRRDGHTLKLSGDSYEAEPIDGSGSLVWQGDSGVRTCGVQRFSPIRQLGSTRYEVRSVNFKHPRPTDAMRPSRNEQGQLPDLARHEYTGAYGARSWDAAVDLVRLRLQELDAAAKHFEARSDDARVQPGRRFKFTGHRDPSEFYRDDSDDHFLVLGVTHEVSNNYQTDVSAVATYANDYTCLRRKIPWRPGRGFSSVDTRIYGPQTVVVATPDDEEIFVDPYGRVRVQFHWDREGRNDASAYTWVRVASPSAGRYFGLVIPPRKGQELVCVFLDGNPDRPLIIGSVYNHANMPPLFTGSDSLPNIKAQSGLSTREIGGSRRQQLRFDDSTGRISAQLGTDHATTQLNLGSLATPMHDGRTQPRGEGGELRSDAQLAVRGNGVLISSAVSPGANGKQLDRAELIGLSQTLQAIVEELGTLADAHQAGNTDPARFRQLVRHLQDWEQGSTTAPGEGPGGAPIVAVSAVAGAAVVSQDNLVLGAQTHIDMTSAGNTQLSAGQKLLLRCTDLFSAYAHAAMRLVSRGRLDLQADSINLTARVVTITASEQITYQAPQIRQVATGVQVDSGDGRIVQQSAGPHIIKSASFSQDTGGGGDPGQVSLPARDLKFDQHIVLTDMNTGLPVPDQLCRIHVEDGQTIDTRTDDRGAVPVFKSAVSFARYSIELLD